MKRFPCLQYAYNSASIGGTMPAVLNAANEIAVNMFLQDKISFFDITNIINKILNNHKPITNPTLDDILQADKWARQEALNNCE